MLYELLQLDNKLITTFNLIFDIFNNEVIAIEIPLTVHVLTYMDTSSCFLPFYNVDQLLSLVICVSWQQDPSKNVCFEWND